MREHPLVDVDSHVLEPMSVWQDYLEPDLRPRAIRWSTDDNGRELMLIDGKPARQFMLRNGWMGSPEVPGGRAFEDRVTTSLGAANGPDRVQLLDNEGIDITLLYPTLGIQWEPEFDDYKLAAAHARAYNSWITDLCKPHSDRLVPVAHVVASDVQEGAAELERAAGLGARGGMVSGRPINGIPYGDPYYDPLWAQARNPASLSPFTSWATPDTSATTCTPTPARRSPGGASSPSAWRSSSASPHSSRELSSKGSRTCASSCWRPGRGGCPTGSTGWTNTPNSSPTPRHYR